MILSDRQTNKTHPLRQTHTHTHTDTHERRKGTKLIQGPSYTQTYHRTHYSNRQTKLNNRETHRHTDSDTLTRSYPDTTDTHETLTERQTEGQMTQSTTHT